MYVIIEKIHNGEKEYFVRKSKWLFIIIILKAILFFVITLGILYFIHIISTKTGHDFKLLEILIAYSSLILSYFAIINSIVNYFYNIIIITNKGIYKFRLGLFLAEDIDIVDLYKIQEIKSHSRGFIPVILNVGELHLVEQKDTEKIIHFIDKPEYIAKIIKGVQHKLIEKRYKKSEEF